MAKWKLKNTKQCAKCPWLVGTNPYKIPNYIPEKHRKLTSTISKHIFDDTDAMACHESTDGNELHCIGWLANQLGPGNNIPLRMHMLSCENSHEIELLGEQHEKFDDTLPKRK